MNENSLFWNRQRAKQLIDFSSLQCGNKHPTDIDGLIENQDKDVVLLEYKYKGRPVDIGQRLALQRIVNDIEISGKRACAIVCDHEQVNPDEDVKAGLATVRESYHHGEWHEATCKITVSEYVSRFLGEIWK